MRHFFRRLFALSANWWLGLALLAGGCAGSIAGADFLPGPSDYEVGGIDVSRYQGDIDWKGVRAEERRLAWIRRTGGGGRSSD